ncbi:MAG: amidohydrolase [Streptosporangiales bacterium]|nr:amidohydrolase [Streptosporangiales bacterium]
MSDPIATGVDADFERARELAGVIHSRPELGFAEHFAADALTRWLGDSGFTVTTGTAGLPTAFTAVSGSGGGTVAYMVEYDALPGGLGHACAHHLIAGGVTLAAVALAASRGDRPGRILVVGTPAEEGGGGKQLLLDAGAFDGVDAALMFHGADRTMVDRPMLASLVYRATFTGTPAHAAKNPEAGRSALSAATLLLHAADTMRVHFGADARLHGIIEDGGQALNVIPERAVVAFQARAATTTRAREIGRWFEESCQAAATMTQTRVAVDRPTPEYAHLVSNPVLAAQCARYLGDAGETVEPVAANEATASTDAGNVSHRVPTLHPFVRVAPRGTPSHSTLLRDAGLEPLAFDGMRAAASALARLGADVLDDEEFRARVRAAFVDDATR